MPVNPSHYPDNWKSLTLEVKKTAQWRCSCCGKKCYEPGERPENLTRSEWTADILQVHLELGYGERSEEQLLTLCMRL